MKIRLFLMSGAHRTARLLQLIFIVSFLLLLSSCQTIDLYERVVPIPQHEWQSSLTPVFKFTIKDTTADYQLYVILRHNEKYNYNNIWLNLYANAPQEPTRKFTVELPLATNERGWLGSGMDDVYDHRIALTLDPQQFNFNKPGDYTFRLEQIMREDPLEHVMDVGLRIEKKQP